MAVRETTRTRPESPASTFDQLLAEYEAAHADFDHDDPVSERRYHEAFGAVRSARPTDSLDVAKQARWALKEGQIDEDYHPIVEAAATMIERLATPAATTEDPHIAWWQEWYAVRREILDYRERYDDDAPDELESRASALERQITRTQPHTLAGALVLASMTAWMVEIFYLPGRDETFEKDGEKLDHEHYGMMMLLAYLREIAPPELVVRAPS